MIGRKSFLLVILMVGSVLLLMFQNCGKPAKRSASRSQYSDFGNLTEADMASLVFCKLVGPAALQKQVNPSQSTASYASYIASSATLVSFASTIPCDFEITKASNTICPYNTTNPNYPASATGMHLRALDSGLPLQPGSTSAGPVCMTPASCEAVNGFLKTTGGKLLGKPAAGAADPNPWVEPAASGGLCAVVFDDERVSAELGSLTQVWSQAR
jgi:hypothetical protein